jgi:hypothetical protein
MEQHHLRTLQGRARKETYQQSALAPRPPDDTKPAEKEVEAVKRPTHDSEENALGANDNGYGRNNRNGGDIMGTEDSGEELPGRVPKVSHDHRIG